MTTTSYYQYNDCCCAPCLIHVKKGAFLIAIIGTVLCTIFAILSFTLWALSTILSPLFVALLCLIQALAYASVLLALNKENYRLFWPYLILEAILLVGQFVSFGFQFYFMLVLFFMTVNQKNNHILPAEFYVVYALFFAIFAIWLIVNVWFYSVIFRAYKFIKNEGIARAYPAA